MLARNASVQDSDIVPQLHTLPAQPFPRLIDLGKFLSSPRVQKGLNALLVQREVVNQLPLNLLIMRANVTARKETINAFMDSLAVIDYNPCFAFGWHCRSRASGRK